MTKSMNLAAVGWLIISCVKCRCSLTMVMKEWTLHYIHLSFTCNSTSSGLLKVCNGKWWFLLAFNYLFFCCNAKPIPGKHHAASSTISMLSSLNWMVEQWIPRLLPHDLGKINVKKFLVHPFEINFLYFVTLLVSLQHIVFLTPDIQTHWWN